MSRPRSLSPAAEYEERFGAPGTWRGIRAGKSSRRRREAYIREQVSLGRAESEVAIVRPGGQSRPLGTHPLWSPSQSGEETEQEEIEITSDSLAVLTQQIQPVWLGPRTSLVRPSAKARLSQSASSSSKSRPAPKARPAEPSEPPVIRDILTSDLIDGLRCYHPPPSVEKSVGVAGQTPQAVFDPSVKVYIWDQEVYGTSDRRALREPDETIPCWPKAAVLAFDYHQVLDVDRSSRFRTDRIGQDLLLPPRHLETLAELRSLIEEGGGKQKLILCSHIERSENNLRNLLNVTQTSQAPFDAVLITSSRTGPAGKLAALKAIAPGGQYCLLDDNPEIAAEFSGERFPFVQIRKPRQNLVVEQRHSDWSASGETAKDLARRFLTFNQRRAQRSVPR